MPNSSSAMLMITSAFAVAILAGYAYFNSRPYLFRSYNTEPDYDPSREHVHCNEDTPDEPRKRIEFGGGPGATVYGWPSQGGVLILEACTRVDFNFFGIHQIDNASPSSDQFDEDEHCAKMRQLGAEWWYSIHERFVHEVFADVSKASPWMIVGRPERGGVCVLKTTNTDAYSRGLGRIRHADDMEERCRLIESLGGAYHRDPAQCPGLDLHGTKYQEPRS